MALNRQQSFEKFEEIGAHINRNDLAKAPTLAVPGGGDGVVGKQSNARMCGCALMALRRRPVLDLW